MITSYRDLEVWQKAMDLAEECYHATGGFPKEEIYGLTSQIRRAATSVAANIAEGRGRRSTRDFLRFLGIAYGSLLELETHVLLAERLDLCDAKIAESLLDRSGEVGRMLNGLRSSLATKVRSRAEHSSPTTHP
ncbi:MAG: four helix bundle protein [Gemmatimonadota bacterium]